MTISDVLIILATLLSPLIAVQVQKWIERGSERRTAQKQVFYDLMATRATRVAPKHVEALNKIDLEFDAKGSAKHREVVNRWRIYADHLGLDTESMSEAQLTQWSTQGNELFTDLLVALAAAFDYPFDRVQLKRGIYYPRAHGEAEKRREIYEQAVLHLITGQSSLNMRVTEFPFSEDDAALSRRLHEGFVRAFSEDGALKTKAV